MWLYIDTYTHVLYLEDLLASDLYNRRHNEIYFPKFYFWEKPKTIKHVENNGKLNVRYWRKNEHKETNFPFGERNAEFNPPPPFRKLSIRFQKNLRQIHKPLSTCQMDWKLA